MKRLTNSDVAPVTASSVALVVLLAVVPAYAWLQQAAASKSVDEGARLAPSEKQDVVLALQLQRQLGDEVWPGFGAARIPYLVYNDAFDVLLGADGVPAGWEAVGDDDVNGQRYARRKSAGHSSFAVKVGEQWVGSMASRQRMNREMAAKVGAIETDQYSVMVLHEAFHAFQARVSEKRFQRALATYRAQDTYPFQNKEFAQAWTQEGAALAAAMEAGTADATTEAVRRFLAVRDARRQAAGLSPDAVDYERELEWLEGLGKYVETRLYELAARNEMFAAGNRFRPSRFYWSDSMQLKGMLGVNRGDLRFYLSGNAQARLLDRLAPGWKTHVMDDGVYLEDLLRTAVQTNSG